MNSWRHEVRQEFGALRELVTRLDTAIVVRDPGGARSVDAYDGLRKQVASAMRERRAHLTQLAAFSDALERGASTDSLRLMVEEWALQAGLSRIAEPTHESFFEVVEGKGGDLEVTAPAWVDASDPDRPIVIKPGLARRLGVSGDELAPARETPTKDAAVDEEIAE